MYLLGIPWPAAARRSSDASLGISLARSVLLTIGVVSWGGRACLMAAAPSVVRDYSTRKPTMGAACACSLINRGSDGAPATLAQPAEEHWRLVLDGSTTEGG